MFEELLSLDNIEVRIFNDSQSGFHPKGYLFKEKDLYKIIIGSSNLTQTALATNQEWNLYLTSLENGEIVNQVMSEFNYQWECSKELTHDWIENYKKIYQEVKPQRAQTIIVNEKITPNKMQEEALLSLKGLREEGKDKALLISATGTGKTYLSAFDVAAYQPKKMLFVIHRENIARAAMKTFKKVIKNKTMGLYTGTTQDQDVDYLFATVQTISKEEHFSKFAPDAFDYIIIDEVHRAGAASYQKLLGYFKPQFLLGMTATPERGDGFDIYQMFDYNIAYEIRLKQAMEYDLLCPFHYYGITDLTINGETVDDNTTFNSLVSDVRVDHILENIHKFGYSGDRVRGLIFCSRKEEARKLSDLFNERGFKTCALTGDDNEEARRQAMDSLESDDPHSLEYIFTVDIFNEGIDIPKVNQVIMLRPTESAIIFVQQLGRGLRKNDSKEYVIVIDFIGNYEKNFLIPIALSGSMAYNKDELRRFISEGTLIIPGCSTISFDRITQERIYKSIDTANFSDIRIIKESYNQLKAKLGRIPHLVDFDNYGSIDVLRIFQNKSLGSYHKFLSKYEKDYHIEFDLKQEKYLTYISTKLAEGKRIHELEAIKVAIEDHENVLAHLKNKLFKEYHIDMPELSYATIINCLTQNFATGTGSNTFSDSVFISEQGKDYKISDDFINELENKAFKDQVLEVVNFGIKRYKENYSQRYGLTDFCLYKKYTYEDVCRLLNWDKSVVALNIGGYKYDARTNTFPVFINYYKEEEIADSVKYEDHLIDQDTLVAYSKNGRNLDSEEIKRVYDESHTHVQVHLFVRKNKDDKGSKEFYYLGQMHAIDTPELEVMPNTSQNVVKLTYELEQPVRKDIYDYITE